MRATGDLAGQQRNGEGSSSFIRAMETADIPPWSMFLTGTGTFLQVCQNSKQNFAHGYLMTKMGTSYSSHYIKWKHESKIRHTCLAFVNNS